MATGAKSHGFAESRAAVSRASNCGCVNPRVGDSAGDSGTADMPGRRVLEDAVQDAGPVEPGRDGEPAGDGGGLEPADLLHPPDVELQVRPLDGQRVQAALGAPGQVAAQVRFGVRAGGALETGQVGSYCQSQPVTERLRRIAGRWGQLGEGHHAPRLQRRLIFVKLTQYTNRDLPAAIVLTGDYCRD